MLVVVIVMVVVVVMFMVVVMVMVVVMFIMFVTMAMWRYGMWNKVEKSISQQASRCKTEQHFEQGAVLCCILEGNKEQDNKRGCTN